MARELVEVKQRSDGMWLLMVNDALGITQTPIHTVNGDVVVYGRREDAEFMTDYWLHKGVVGPTWSELEQRLQQQKASGGDGA